jgi:hypothetical protein
VINKTHLFPQKIKDGALIDFVDNNDIDASLV